MDMRKLIIAGAILAMLTPITGLARWTPSAIAGDPADPSSQPPIPRGAATHNLQLTLTDHE